MKAVSRRLLCLCIAAAFFAGFVCTQAWDDWYTKTYTPSLMPSVRYTPDTAVPCTIGVYGSYAGSVTYRSADSSEHTLYVYCETVSAGVKTYRNSPDRMQYDYNLKVQDSREHAVQSVTYSGARSFPVNDPQAVTYEGFYPQFIQQQDETVANALYAAFYDGNAQVFGWENAYTES